jgi:tetratricopeptide (TPR) repeat protein
VAFATIKLGASSFFTGDWVRARAYFERVRPLAERSPVNDAAPLLEFGRLFLAEGAWEEAARCLAECSSIARTIELRIQDRVAESLLAELDLLQGRSGAALTRLLPLLDRDGMEERMVTTYVLPVLAWAYLESGDTAQAAHTIADALRQARAAGYRLTLVGALRVQALVAMRQDDRLAAEHALEEGLALARPMPYPHGEGRLLEVYGLLHVQQHELDAARERLEAALAIFGRLGARKDLERTEQLLTTLG